MSNYKDSYIEQFTMDLRKALDVKTPIEPKDIVRLLGGKIKMLEPDNDKEAKIEKSGDSFEIYIGDKTPSNREKFSIAHEIGHLFLHMGYLIDKDKWEKVGNYKDSVMYRYGYSVEEKEANQFAGALLMPIDEFFAVAESCLDNDSYTLKPIADHFKVSVDAVRMRGRYLGLFSWDS